MPLQSYLSRASSTMPWLRACLATALALAAAPALTGASAQAAERPNSIRVLRGTIDRVEKGRLEVDSAWVEARRHTRFVGRAHKLRQIQVGQWAKVKGHYDERGIFVADTIVTRHIVPGHNDQAVVEHQAFGERAKIHSAGTLYSSPEVKRYVDWVGTAVVPDWAKRKFDFRFEVLSDPNPNAFALPDGTIFVNTGLLEAVENDDQLAAILGHEVAHVTEYHGLRHFMRERRLSIIYTIIQELLEESADDEKGVPVIEIAASIGVDAIVSAALKHYDRALEDQADRVGLRYAAEAGFDPHLAPRIWEILTNRGADRGESERYFYLNASSNKARRANQEKEIALHYSDVAQRLAARDAAREPAPVDLKQLLVGVIRDDAIVDYEARRYAQAAAAFSEVLRRSGDDAVAHTYLGVIARDSSDSPQHLAHAESEFRKAIETDPSYPDAHRALGRLLASQGGTDEARSELAAYLRLAPQDAGDRRQVEQELSKLETAAAPAEAPTP